ncbi:MAG: lamin tail domain-containing protein [Myxococcales bacterium]|nr:lamin tail domain-containing protein [Myxococcales bacterium]
MRPLLAVLVATAACASGSSDQPIDAATSPTDGRTVDAAAVDAAAVDAPGAGPDAAVVDARVVDAAVIDAAVIDAPPPIDAAPPIDGPPPVITSLLLSEVVLTPTGGEFVEIVNPTAAAVDLSNFYVSDTSQYFRLPAGVAAVAADATDFVARFPAGASIPAHGVVTVALDTAANFTTTYPGVTPTYSVSSATMTVLTTGTATLTNAGEPIVLFFWDGASDKVTDVDIMIAGSPSAANLLANKSGVAIDGPDADSATGAYATDANTLPTQSAPGAAKSTKRIALESTLVETQAGTGNGVAGHDETSEQLGTTWDASPYTAPTPGQVPAALVP